VSTGEEWDSIAIHRTLHGKPYYGRLHYSVSRADGIIVLVGWPGPIGVDIVSRGLDFTSLSSSDLASVFSATERQKLATCVDSKDFNDLYLLTWAFKEAYMKSTGLPDWDSIASKEFRSIRIPETAGVYYTMAASSIFIDGSSEPAYTESHNLDDSHFIAIYSNLQPIDQNNNTFRFERKRLEDMFRKLEKCNR
jgi:phosphopantetheinyl transferase (holo-ACP synthase)